MSNNPIQVLMDEHDVIQQLENVIKEMKLQIASNSVGYKENLLKVLDFLKNYSDGYHHFKEEEVLFPAMSEHPDFRLQPILDEMLEHHESFREYASSIRENAESGNYEEAHKILEKYFSELQDHIAVENDELFSMAEHLFDPSELENIYFKFADIDRELGEKRKQDFEKMLRELV